MNKINKFSICFRKQCQSREKNGQSQLKLKAKLQVYILYTIKLNAARKSF